MTAQAVKESFERTFAKSNRAKTFFTYDSITADGQILTIQTDKAYPNLPGSLGDPLFVIVDVQSERDGRAEQLPRDRADQRGCQRDAPETSRAERVAPGVCLECLA